MTFQELQQHVPLAVDALVKSVHAHPNIQHLGPVSLPNRDAVIHSIDLLQQLVYPGYFGMRGLNEHRVGYRVGELLNELTAVLYEQVSCAMRYGRHIGEREHGSADRGACDESAAKVVAQFLDRIPAVRELLAADVQATVEGDPAAHDADEAIFCYPGVVAITVQRFAHELYKLEVPLLPRIMTEHAHSVTGIDIHPGAKLGLSFFIDHGTGVVIGETTEIGNNVKIYQGVTLGALVLAPHEKKMGLKKRHPTIEDDVTIFSGTTILGGKTVIGKGSVISGNVFITKSVPAMHVVPAEEPRPHTFERREELWGENYQI